MGESFNSGITIFDIVNREDYKAYEDELLDKLIEGLYYIEASYTHPPIASPYCNQNSKKKFRFRNYKKALRICKRIRKGWRFDD